MNILFVCTGNVCRSPMAEAFLKHEAAARGLDLDVRSTGTHAWSGRTATIDGRRTMRELGVSMDDHRTLELEPSLVDWSDLTFGLAREHRLQLRREYPDAAWKTFLLKEFVHLLPHLPPFTEPEPWVRAADELRERVADITDLDVDDPFGERSAAYQRVATEIQGLITTLAEGFESKLVRTS